MSALIYILLTLLAQPAVRGLTLNRERLSWPGTRVTTPAEAWRKTQGFLNPDSDSQDFRDDGWSSSMPRLDNRLGNGMDEGMSSGPIRSRCDRRIRVVNGATRVRDRGTLARFQCSYGFHMLGASVAVCVKGKWSDPPPLCIRDGCGKLPIPIHGTLRLLYGGAVGIFTCNYGYNMEGERMLTCDGQRWNGTAPLCIERPPIVVTPFTTTFPPIPVDLDTTTMQTTTTTTTIAMPTTTTTTATTTEVATDNTTQQQTDAPPIDGMDGSTTVGYPSISQPIPTSDLETDKDIGGFAAETTGHEKATTQVEASTTPSSVLEPPTNASLHELENSVTTPASATPVGEVDPDTATEFSEDDLEEKSEGGLDLSTTEKALVSTVAPTTTPSSIFVIPEADMATPSTSTASPTQNVPATSPSDSRMEEERTIEVSTIPSVSEPTQEVDTTEDSAQAIPPTPPMATLDEIDVTPTPVTKQEWNSSEPSDIVPIPPQPEVESSTIIYDITTAGIPTVETTTEESPPETASTQFHEEVPFTHDKIREYVAISPSKLDVDATTHLAVGHLLVIAGSALVTIGFITIVAGILMYCWRKNKGIARPRRNDVDGRTLSFHEGVDELVWFDPRDNTRL